jgi:hypothetical protein
MSLLKDTPAPDAIEKDFTDALKHLVEGEPTHKKLKAMLKSGKLKINTVTVALEAGRSRTLIGMDKCRYPKVREAIRLAQGGKKSEPSTYTQAIENLRADLAKAKAENKLLQVQISAHFIARKRAEESAQRDGKIVSQLRKELREVHKVVSLTSAETPPLPRLVLIRGLPGSGKTTRAQDYKKQGYEHFEADMFFEVEGDYVFDEAKLGEAHAWCLLQTRMALSIGAHVVVANVFAQLEDLKPFTDLGFDWEVVEATGGGESVHGIPSTVIRGMKENWVPIDTLLPQLRKKGPAKQNVTPIARKKPMDGAKES